MPDESWDAVLERTRRAGPSPADPSPRAADEEAMLPAAGDPYKAASFPANRSLTRLVLVMGKEGFQQGGKAYLFFQYVHLDSDTDFAFTREGQIFTLRFAGIKPAQMVVRGRNLLRICDYIHLHRMPWIRMADRDFTTADGVSDKEPIITNIQVVPVEG
jgi:hypothetical protein